MFKQMGSNWGQASTNSYLFRSRHVSAGKINVDDDGQRIRPKPATIRDANDGDAKNATDGLDAVSRAIEESIDDDEPIILTCEDA